MIHILPVLLSFCAFTALCIAMPKHQQGLIGRKLAPARTAAIRPVAFVLLGLVLILDFYGQGIGYGMIIWFGHLTLGAAATLMFLNWRTKATKSR